MPSFVRSLSISWFSLFLEKYACFCLLLYTLAYIFICIQALNTFCLILNILISHIFLNWYKEVNIVPNWIFLNVYQSFQISFNQERGKEERGWGGSFYDASLISFAGVCLFLEADNKEGFYKERAHRLSIVEIKRKQYCTIKYKESLFSIQNKLKAKTNKKINFGLKLCTRSIYFILDIDTFTICS